MSSKKFRACSPDQTFLMPRSLRKETVEPVFGQIKQCMGFRQFSMRGQEACDAEWSLVCAAHNLLKLFRHGASAMARQAQRCADPGQQSPAMAFAKPTRAG